MADCETPEPYPRYSASFSDQSEVSLPGPLKQLRIASLTPETQHSVRQRPLKRSKPARNHEGRKLIQAKKSVNDAGFGFGVDFPTSGPNSVYYGPADLCVKDSQQMAAIFLTSAKSVKAKYNVVDSVLAKDSLQVLKLLEGIPVHILPAVRRRAEIVKETLEMRYSWLERTALALLQDQQAHPGLDCCYNPLQVLRNRVTRKKLHHPMPPASPNPLPCDAFSSHRHQGGKPWKMLWGIDLNELVADFAWRRVHWAELRNAKGGLWFPEAAAERQTPPRHLRVSQKLHDKLWNDSDSEKRDDSFLLDIPFERAKELRGKNWKEKAKRLYGLLSTSAVDLRALGEPYHVPLKSLDGLSAVRIARVGRSLSADETTQLYQFVFGGDIEKNGSGANMSNGNFHERNLPPPQIIIGDGNSSQQLNLDVLEEDETKHTNGKNGEPSETVEKVNNIYFGSAHLKLLVQHLERSPGTTSSSSVEAGPLQQSTYPDETQLRATAKALEYLGAASFLECHFLEAVYPQLLESTSNRLDMLLQEDTRHLLRSINQVHTGLLPARENLYKGFIEEAKSITHLANDECAVKIDNLLSATDRSYGELNTSLIMELRKTNERLERLNRSLFSGVIGNSAIVDESTRIYDIGNHTFLYCALENSIVVLLRLVWIGVNILKPVFIFFKILWKLVTVIFK